MATVNPKVHVGLNNSLGPAERHLMTFACFAKTLDVNSIIQSVKVHRTKTWGHMNKNFEVELEQQSYIKSSLKHTTFYNIVRRAMRGNIKRLMEAYIAGLKKAINGTVKELW